MTNKTRQLRLDESRTARRVVAEPAITQPLMLGLTPWHADPVAQRYTTAQPSERAVLRNKTFAEALLYRTLDGGAIILQTVDRRVLAMNYCNHDDLEYHWRETLSYYAGVV